MRHSLFLLLLIAPVLAPEAESRQERKIKDLTNPGIRAHRTGALVITTAPGAKVKVTQLRHDFGFGTALSSRLFSTRIDRGTRDRYLKIARENFNCAVTENALKWPNMERRRGKIDWSVIDAMVDFCQRHNFRFRGHCLFWANEKRVPEWARALSDEELRRTLEKHTREVLRRCQGKFDEYDVNNEMIHHDYFKRRFGEEIRIEMFRLAKQADPKARYYLNDYNILTGQDLERYAKHIRWFLDKGAPVDGIGCQGHFNKGVPDYRTVKGALDRLATFGLPITITEFDINTGDEARKARDLDAFFRICFSHPAVDGILMWGFWEGAHWRPQAALWKRDFSPTPAAKAYRDLVFREWWTSWEGKADAAGRCRVEAFFGRHRVEAGGAAVEVDFPRRAGKEKAVRVGAR